MNQNHRTPPPTPQPLCAAYESLLPLLSLNQLDAEESSAVRAHVSTCDFCQRQINDYDQLRDALRQQAALDSAPAQPAPVFTFEAIVAAADEADGAFSDENARDTDQRHATAGGSALGRTSAPRRGSRGRWTTLGALAAVLLLAVLAATLFGRPGGQYGATVIPDVGTLATFPLSMPGSQPRAIIAGPNGDLWFTENGGIGSITPHGNITEYPVPGSPTLLGLTVGPDGAIWFTYSDDVGGKIGRLDPRDGQISSLAAPTGGVPGGPIVAGPDGALWFILDESGPSGSGPGKSAIVRMTTGGAMTTLSLPIPHPPNDLAIGPDHNLWFTTWGTGHDTIGRMTLSGNLTQFPTPDFNGHPTRLITGPDGNLWFLEGAGLIGRITPRGVITEFTPSDGATLGDIAIGPDSNLWFTDNGYLGRITPAGAIKEVALPHGITFNGLALGPDHRLWFTSIASDTVSRLELTR